VGDGVGRIQLPRPIQNPLNFCTLFCTACGKMKKDCLHSDISNYSDGPFQRLLGFKQRVTISAIHWWVHRRLLILPQTRPASDYSLKSRRCVYAFLTLTFWKILRDVRVSHQIQNRSLNLIPNHKMLTCWATALI
jgi:hypothetical protein